MRVVAESGNDELARVYIAESHDGRIMEFVESVQPPTPLDEKWVLILSTLFGCPVGCPFCDAGNFYEGRLSAEEILSQVEYLVRRRFPGGRPETRRLKVQFARMGEPSLNDAVLEVLERLPDLYPGEVLFPSLSTVAPAGRDDFFQELLRIKNRLYGPRFQLQFSIHSTDPSQRDGLVPVEKWSLGEIAGYGKSFFRKGERKVTLNFALAKGVEVDAQALNTVFDKDSFLVKITPVNPTYQALRNGIASYIEGGDDSCGVAGELRALGYEVIVSIGELEENHIGSNCGQHMTHYLEAKSGLKDSYTYPIVGESEIRDAAH